MKKQLPNIVSLSRVPLGILFFVIFRSGSAISEYSAAVILAALITDIVDGYIARKFHLHSVAGKWLDAFSDFLFFLFVYISFYTNSIMPLSLLILFVCREALMYSIIRPMSVVKKLDVGARPAGKVKTALQSIGTLGIAVMRAVLDNGGMGKEAFGVSARIILSVLIGVSVLSLYWYVVPLLRKGNTEPAGDVHISGGGNDGRE